MPCPPWPLLHVCDPPAIGGDAMLRDNRRGCSIQWKQEARVEPLERLPTPAQLQTSEAL